MPFTLDAFLDVFATYNQALWPFVVALWVATAVVVAMFVSGRPLSTVLLRILLAGHWLWAGVMYHAFFFTAINPAAWLFAAVFVINAVLLLTVRPFDSSSAARRGSTRHAISTLLMVYALLYPAVARADGFVYPRMPTFGVPCPTTVLTIGFLLAVSSRSFLLSAIPFAWSVVGGSAAWLFGVRADIGLPAAAALLAIDLISSKETSWKLLRFHLNNGLRGSRSSASHSRAGSYRSM